MRVLTARTMGIVTEEDRLVNFILLLRCGLDPLNRIGTIERAPVREGEHNGELRRRLR